MMLKIGKITFFAAVVVLLFNSCVSGPSGYDYTAFQESNPRSILVMPPINSTPDVGASSAFLATSTIPLAESGYYVIPVALSTETFRQNGVTVAEEAHAIPHQRLRQIFGADAALYITINRYGTVFMVVQSVVEAGASAKLVDLRTGQELWQGEVYVQLNNNNNNQGNKSLFEMVLNAVVDQVVNTLSNKAYEAGRSANNQLLSAGRSKGLLYGPYHPNHPDFEGE